MKKILFILLVFSLTIWGYDSSAQCTCNGSYIVVYYPQVRQQYYEPQPTYYQQSIQSFPQNNYWYQQNAEPTYYQESSYSNRGQRFSNTLDNIERVVNIFGQVVGIYQQIRGSSYSQQPYYQQQQQYYSPPQQVYYSSY
ncbi:MAG: hypothetical protein GXC72_12290 [Chitinophagaceae bacterium]|nr:hypothetical protein [Chitinophagaceae bacterium]